MIVAVDARSLAAGRGVSRYAREMLEALARGFPGDEQRHVSPRFRRVVFGASALVRAPMLTSVGALEPRKAPELLLGGFARARARGLDAELVVVGTGRRERALAGRPGVTLLGTVGDDELDALYAHALALVHPAFLEGYGLPPLEALVRGTPSVVADLPVYDETLSAGALRFPPGDAAALADALLRVEAERDALLGAAPQPPTWDEAARRLHAVLAE